MDAIVLLKDDHKTVEKLFKQFEKAGERAYKEKQQIVEQIIQELTTHAYIEEEIFYPAARQDVPETSDHVLESVEVYRPSSKLFGQGSSGSPTEPTGASSSG
jgi:hemerythrin superfamily protein